jgi:hypothetical protein
MGQSVPYVRLRTVNMEGDIIDDLNVSFFHKTLDMDTVSDPVRFSDRPTMSLKELSLTTDLSAGYLYFTKVDLRVVIHRPQLLQDNTLLSFLVPGAPLLLEYGWNSPNPFLNRKEHLLFQVKNYSLNLSPIGQVDIHVEGLALNETFNNIYLGDNGEPITIEKGLKKPIKPNGPSDQPSPSEFQFSGLSAINKKLKQLSDFLEDNKKTKKGPNYFIVKSNAETLQKVENRVRGAITKRFKQQKAKLKGQEMSPSPTFGQKSKNKIPCYTLHDVIYNLCGETFSKLGSAFHPAKVKTTEIDNATGSKSEFRVIYGKFNTNAGKFAGKSIGDFPIHKVRLNSLIKKATTNGQIVLTIGWLLNNLVSNFLENPEYHQGFMPDQKRNVFKRPDIAINLTNRGNVIEVQVIDINGDFPPTTSKMTKENEKASDIEKQIVEDNNMPIIRLGHAASFIKNCSMSQITDQHMKAVLIERMNRDRISGLRSTLLPSDNLDESPVTPLTLPLRGTMEVIGHVGWKPFRAFWLSADIYVIDAVYKITKVSHKLSAEGFNTSLEFIYH